jgi:hypothetical protein
MPRESSLCQEFVVEVLKSETASYFLSGTAAFSYLLDVAPIPSEGVILIPSFTCEKLLLPLFARKQRFRLVDNEPNWVTPELAQYEASYSEDTAAIVLVYVWGYAPRDIRAIVEWAKRKRLIIIEDVASAFGLSKDGLPFGSVGDYMFGSFGYDKTIELGEGGFCAGKTLQPESRGRGIKQVPARYNSLIKSGRRVRIFQLRTLLLKTIAAGASSELWPMAEMRERICSTIPSIDEIFVARMKNRLKNTMRFLGARDQPECSRTPGFTFFVPNNDQGIAVRLLARFSDRDSVLRGLRRAGVWVGTDYAYPLDHWTLPGTAPAAKILGRSVLSFITNERNQSIDVCVQKLRECQ